MNGMLTFMLLHVHALVRLTIVTESLVYTFFLPGNGLSTQRTYCSSVPRKTPFEDASVCLVGTFLRAISTRQIQRVREEHSCQQLLQPIFMVTVLHDMISLN